MQLPPQRLACGLRQGASFRPSTKLYLTDFSLGFPPSVQRLVDSGKRAGEEHEREPGKNPSDSVGGHLCLLRGNQAADTPGPSCPELGNQCGLGPPRLPFPW